MMTAADLDAPLAALAADNTHAAALIYGAQEQLSGADLERHILAHAQPALFMAGMAQCLFQAMLLEDAVALWRRWDAYPEDVAREGWTYEQIEAEILAPIFCLTTGRKPCARCLSGNLRDGLASIHADGHDNGHTERCAA